MRAHVRRLIALTATAVCAALVALGAQWLLEPLDPRDPVASDLEVRSQPLPFDPLVRRTLPPQAQVRLRAAWRTWAPELERHLDDGLERVPARWRPGVERARTLVTHRVGIEVAFGMVVGFLALLLIARRGRRPGEVVVSIDYPAELRGSFSVKLVRHRRQARRTPPRERVRAERRHASTSTERLLVSREARFRDVRPGTHWVCVEGELRDATSEVTHEEPFEVQRVVVRPRRTVRRDFQFRPSGCPLSVNVRWNEQPVREFSVVVLGLQHTLRHVRDGTVRLDVPLGCHRVVIGSGDRVAERDVFLDSLRPASVEIDLGGERVVFKGCPHAVAPYLRGHLAEAARYLEREGQGEVASRVRARLEESMGHAQRAATLYGEAGDWLNAVRLLERIEADEPGFVDACEMLADHFEGDGDPEQAIGRIEQAVRACNDEEVLPRLYARLAELIELTEDLPRALEILEQLHVQHPDYDGVTTRIETLHKRISEARRTSGEQLERPPEQAGGGSRYEILEQIGSGGMGIVFRARDKRLEREVALKRLTEALRDHPRAVQLFWREARAAAALNHVNLVTLYDADEEDGRFFITMELLRGSTVSQLVRKFRKLSPRDVALLGRQIATGLEYAHGRAIIHRDIKPGNLFFTEGKVLKIMDFGLAKMIEEVRRQVTVVGGTPFYMAPEQAEGVAVGPPVDVYALGVTLFELLTGQVPFGHGDIAYDHRHTAPPDPLVLVPDAPEPLAELILAMLAKTPSERPTASTARERLESLLRTL